MRAIALPAMNPAIFQFPSSRAQALKRLADFAPGAGRDYAARRNYDLGPGDRSNVSGLSGAVRHRLVLEEELVRTAIATHGLRAAEKIRAGGLLAHLLEGLAGNAPGGLGPLPPGTR